MSDQNQMNENEVQPLRLGSGGTWVAVLIGVVVVAGVFSYILLGTGGTLKSSAVTGTPPSGRAVLNGGVPAAASVGGAAPLSGTPTPAVSGSTEGSASSPAVYTLADVAKHADATSCWTVSEGGVYDVTAAIPGHPGGDKILLGCGKDMTQFFETKHARQMRDLLPAFKIGVLK